jgi:hypothetical protein
MLKVLVFCVSCVCCAVEGEGVIHWLNVVGVVGMLGVFLHEKRRERQQSL